MTLGLLTSAIRENRGTLTYADFIGTVKMMQAVPCGTTWEVIVHPNIARRMDWIAQRPMLRRLYRESGYPFGRNQGAFKRWALLRGRYQ